MSFLGDFDLPSGASVRGSALTTISLAFPNYYIISGPSGCGKTLFMKQLYFSMTENSLPLVNSPFCDPSIKKSDMPLLPGPLRVSYLGQSVSFPDLSLAQLLEMTVGSREPLSRSSRLLDILCGLGLESLSKSLLSGEALESFKCSNLSGGMYMRLRIALAMFLRDPVIMLDETLSMLDHISRARARDLLLEYVQNLPGLVFEVSHSETRFSGCQSIVFK